MYYFAYGSNMNWRQMQKRCPSARFVCIARLTDHQFGITRHSRLRNCGTANVFPAPGSAVWGIMYEISDAELDILDSFEDGYRRAFLPIHPGENGAAPLNALVYIAAIEDNVPLPNAEYRRLMVEGARHWKLPPSYIALLEGIEVAGDDNLR